MQPSATLRRNVAFVAFDGVQSLDISGPMEVFATANRFGGDNAPSYNIVLASPAGVDVTTNAGLRLTGLTALSDLPPQIDTFVVAGGSEEALQAASQIRGLLEDIRAISARSRRTASICVGAFVLAACGLLDGRRATTHWNSCALLKTFRPQVQLEPDAIFVSDPPFYTSGGVTAGIDLSLALVEADLGSKVAGAVAKELLLFIRRPGGQSQFSSCIDRPANSSPRIDRLVMHIMEHVVSDLSLSAMAAIAGMSERSLSRRFKREVGVSPAAFVESARTEKAKVLLETTEWPLARVAERSGWQSVSVLHRAFMSRVGITPQAYRERFGTRPAARDVHRLDKRLHIHIDPKNT